MLTNLLLGLAAPDMALPQSGTPGEVPEETFSDVIENVTKAPQPIDIKENSILFDRLEEPLEQALTTEPDDSADHSLAADAETAGSAAAVAATELSADIESTALPPAVGLRELPPASRSASSPEKTTSAAENGRLEGQLLPPTEPSGPTSSAAIRAESALQSDTLAGSRTAQPIAEASRLDPHTRSVDPAAGVVTPLSVADTDTPAATPARGILEPAATQATALPPAAERPSSSGMRSSVTPVQQTMNPPAAAVERNGPATVIMPPAEAEPVSSSALQSREMPNQNRGAAQMVAATSPEGRAGSDTVSPVPRGALVTPSAAENPVTISGQPNAASTPANASNQPTGASTPATASNQPDVPAQLPDVRTPTSLADRLQQRNSLSLPPAGAGSNAPPTVTQNTQTVSISAAELASAVTLSGLPALKSDAPSILERSLSRERSARVDARVSDATLSAAGTSTATDSLRTDAGVLRADAPAAMSALPAQLARQVLHSHAQNLSELRLQLKPEELGSIDLKLRVDGDRVHVAMVTAQPGVRELLEAQLPQLRQMLEQGGLQLGDVDVTQRDSGAPGDQSQQTAAIADDSSARTQRDVPADDHERPVSPDGLIDAFV